MRNLISVCLVLFALSSVQAEERTSSDYAACLDKSGGVTLAMKDCIREELERQDLRLNGAYKNLMDSLPRTVRPNCVMLSASGLHFAMQIVGSIMILRVDRQLV